MTERRQHWALWGAAAILLALGVVLSVRSLHAIRAAAATISERQDALAAVADLQAGQAGYEAALARFENSPARPPGMAALVRDALPDVTPDDMRDLSQPLLPGWVLSRYELSFRRVTLERLAELLKTATQPVGEGAAARPSWRMSKCVIRAAAGEPGAGQVVLVLETIDREGA